MKIRRPSRTCGITPSCKALSMTGREQPMALASSPGMRAGRHSVMSSLNSIGARNVPLLIFFISVIVLHAKHLWVYCASKPCYLDTFDLIEAAMARADTQPVRLPSDLIDELRKSGKFANRSVPVETELRLRDSLKRGAWAELEARLTPRSRALARLAVERISHTQSSG